MSNRRKCENALRGYPPAEHEAGRLQQRLLHGKGMLLCLHNNIAVFRGNMAATLGNGAMGVDYRKWYMVCIAAARKDIAERAKVQHQLKKDIKAAQRMWDSA